MSTIQLSKSISLNAITLDDAFNLKQLMHRIYLDPKLQGKGFVYWSRYGCNWRT